MNIFTKKKGKPFYLFFFGSVIMTLLPIALASVFCVNTLRQVEKTSSENMISALRTQLRFHEVTSPSRQYVSASQSLREYSEQLKGLAAKPSLNSTEAAQVYTWLSEVYEPNSRYTYHMYFTGSNSLFSTDGEALSKAERASIEKALTQIDFDDISYSHNCFGPDTQESYITTYAAVLVPGVAFLAADSFSPVDRQKTFFSYDIVKQLENCQIANYDSFGNYHAFSDAFNLIELYDYYTVGQEESGYFSFTHEGENYLCLYVDKEFNHTKFVLFCKDAILNAHKSIMLLMNIGVLFLLLAFCMMAFLFAVHSYKPISSLVDRVDAHAQKITGGSRDDYAILENALNTLDTMSLKVQKQEEVLRNTCLYRLLRGMNTTRYQPYLQEWLFKHQASEMCVSLVRVDTADDELEEVACSFFKEKGYELLSLWEEDGLLLVFTLHGQTAPEIKESFDLFSKHWPGEPIEAFVSGVHTGIDQLWMCYDEAIRQHDEYEPCNSGNDKQSCISEEDNRGEAEEDLEHPAVTTAYIAQLRERLGEAMEEISAQNMGQSSAAKRFEQIQTYVMEHYRDPNLSAGAVAERFGISQSSLSQLFKTYLASGFLEYVHFLRVGNAIELLEKTDMTVSDIALQVGYTNTTTMTRAFKRYAHATPGTIRKIAQAAHD